MLQLTVPTVLQANHNVPTVHTEHTLHTLNTLQISPQIELGDTFEHLAWKLIEISLQVKA